MSGSETAEESQTLDLPTLLVVAGASLLAGGVVSAWLFTGRWAVPSGGAAVSLLTAGVLLAGLSKAQAQ